MLRSNKPSFLLVIILAIALAMPNVAFAHTGEEHNEELERMLFGDDGATFATTHKDRGDAEGRAIQALEDAAYLCIDQYGRTSRKGDACINRLRGYWVQGVPRHLSEINPAGTGMAHRSYTHQGWDHDYSSSNTSNLDAREHAEKWEKRKTVLLNTVDKVFGFTLFSTGWLFGHSDKCNSLAALIYYLHVLGDYCEDKNYSMFFEGSNGQKIPFAVQNPSDDNPDLFWEMRKHLVILFGDQEQGRRVYLSLLQQFDTLAKRARRLDANKSDATLEEANESYTQSHECAWELMALLTGFDDRHSDWERSRSRSYSYANRIHMLLMNEEWFTRAFPSLRSTGLGSSRASQLILLENPFDDRWRERDRLPRKAMRAPSAREGAARTKRARAGRPEMGHFQRFCT